MPRPKQPTALAAVLGFPGRRPRNMEEPKPPNCTGAEAPAYLPAQAAVIWDDLAPQLKALGLLTVIDVRALASACRLQALGEAYLAEEEARLAEIGPRAGKAATKAAKPSPALWAAAKMLEKAHAIFIRFGITPAERTRIRASPPQQEDPVGTFQKRRPGRPA